jgi:hypothetical protein
MTVYGFAGFSGHFVPCGQTSALPRSRHAVVPLLLVHVTFPTRVAFYELFIHLARDITSCKIIVPR